MSGLPPLSDEERAKVREQFAQWVAEHGYNETPGYDFTDGEMTWEWAYWTYRKEPSQSMSNEKDKKDRPDTPPSANPGPPVRAEDGEEPPPPDPGDVPGPGKKP